MGMLKLSILSISLLLNILLVGLGIVFVAKRGGITYLSGKLYLLNSSKVNVMYDTPFYRDKKSHFETLPKSSSEIIFLGDSLTDLAEWAELLRNENVRNRGICGDTTDGVLNRLTNIVESHPQALFIMIGINDLNKGREVNVVLENYRMILARIKQETPKTQVFIQSLLPVNYQLFGNYGLNEKVRMLNAQLKKLAEEFSFQYIDLFPAFLDSNNELDPRYTTDGVHLNGKGYLIWQKIIENNVNKR